MMLPIRHLQCTIATFFFTPRSSFTRKTLRQPAFWPLRTGGQTCSTSALDNVRTMREVYEAVIRWCAWRQVPGRAVRCVRVVAAGVLAVLRHEARPQARIYRRIGPYHYKMIAESFRFDTARIKQRLGLAAYADQRTRCCSAQTCHYFRNRGEHQRAHSRFCASQISIHGRDPHAQVDVLKKGEKRKPSSSGLVFGIRLSTEPPCAPRLRFRRSTSVLMACKRDSISGG